MTPSARGWNEEKLSETPAVHLLERLGYTYVSAEALEAERQSFKDTILEKRLAKALKKLNPWLDDSNVAKAIKAVAKVNAASLAEANEKLFVALTYGISLEQDRGAGKKGQTVRFFDFDEPTNNELIVSRQYKVLGSGLRRLHAVGFLDLVAEPPSRAPGGAHAARPADLLPGPGSASQRRPSGRTAPRRPHEYRHHRALPPRRPGARSERRHAGRDMDLPKVVTGGWSQSGPRVGRRRKRSKGSNSGRIAQRESTGLTIASPRHFFIHFSPDSHKQVVSDHRDPAGYGSGWSRSWSQWPRSAP